MNTNEPKKLFRLTCVAVILAFGVLMPACGGGGSGGGGVTNPLTARFAPLDPNPSPDTISMGGTATGANVAVRVQVTDISDFLGAAFRVTYDPASVGFVGFSSTGSFLETFAGGKDFDARELDPGNPGTVIVVATIQDASQPAGLDVTGTQMLITLNFQATTTTGGNAIAFADPRDVQICAVQGQACNEVSGQLTWSGGTISASR